MRVRVSSLGTLKALRFVSAIAAVVLLGATDAPPTTVPIEIERGVIFVSGEINGIGPLLFVLDPGAGDFLTVYGDGRLRKRPATKLRIGGADVPVEMDVFPGDSNGLVPNHDASRGTIAGSIGPALLEHYAVELDYRNSTMRLTPWEAFTPPAKSSHLSFTVNEDRMPIIEALVDGAPARIEVDLRAPTSMLFPDFLRRSGIAQRYADAPVVKTSGSRMAHAIRSISIGGHELSAVTAWFSQDTSGKFASTAVAGLLGNNVWEHFVVTLDYRNHFVYLFPPNQ